MYGYIDASAHWLSSWFGRDCESNLCETTSQTECGLGSRHRTLEPDNVTCYLFELSNVSLRDALWRCCDRGAELFEPMEVMEMLWVEEELGPKRMGGGTEWNVYGHSEFYGLEDLTVGTQANH